VLELAKQNLETRLFEAYFRKFGKNADQPMQEIDYFDMTAVKTENKKQSLIKEHYAKLSNTNGRLAYFKLSEGKKDFCIVRSPYKIKTLDAEYYILDKA
jgi:hypothetical protein